MNQMEEFSFRLDGDWRPPPLDPADWDPWWLDLAEELAKTDGRVRTRPLSPLMTLVTSQAQGADMILVTGGASLIDHQGRAAESEEQRRPGSELVIAPLVLTLNGKGPVRGGAYTLSEVLPGREVSLASGRAIERVLKVFDGDEFVAIEWRYDLGVAHAGNPGVVSFITNGVEFIDDVAKRVLDSVFDLIVLPGADDS